MLYDTFEFSTQTFAFYLQMEAIWCRCHVVVTLFEYCVL